MPSLTRLSVVITPEQHQLLSRLSALQGRSQASYVRRLLDMAEPFLQRVLTPLERLEREELRFDNGYGRMIADALDEAEDGMRDQFSFLDPLEVEDLHETAEADRSEPSEARTHGTASRRAANS